MAGLKLLNPEQMPLGAKITRNVAYNGVRLILLAPLPLVVIPFFLKKLGTSGYGTWAIFLAVNGLTSLADLGLVTALSKHVAEFYAVKDFPALRRLINTGLVLYLGIAGLLAGILWISSSFLLTALFRGSPIPARELEILWYYLILLVFANILTLFLSSVVIGLQRMDLSAGINSLNILCAAGLSILFLSWNWGLRGVLYAYVLAAWIAAFIYVYVAHGLLPEVRLSLASCRWAVAKEILGFGLTAYVTTIAVVIHNQIEKVYLAHFVGVVPVGLYDISSDLALKLRAIPSFVLGPIMPAASELHALTDQSRLVHLYYRTHKYLALIGVPLLVYVTFVSKHFVELWVGPSLSMIAMPLSTLLIVNFINVMTGPGLSILVGGGILKPGVYSAILGIVSNVTMSLFLIRAFGFRGAVIGTSLALMIGSVSFLYMFRQKTGNTYSGVLRRAYTKPVVCCLAIVAGFWLFTGKEHWSWARLVFEGIIFGTAYLLSLLLVRFFDDRDVDIVESFFPIARIARRIIPDAKLGCALLPDSESASTASR